jgi:hypothetical protein
MACFFLPRKKNGKAAKGPMLWPRFSARSIVRTYVQILCRVGLDEICG